MTNFIQGSFFIHVPDLAQGLHFFEVRLGFQKVYANGNYAYLEREGVAIRLLGYDGADIAPQTGDRRFAYYIDVRDVDSLYAELAPKLADLPEGDVLGPVSQTYGQRELMIIAPDGNLIVFGQEEFIPANVQQLSKS